MLIPNPYSFLLGGLVGGIGGVVVHAYLTNTLFVS